MITEYILVKYERPRGKKYGYDIRKYGVVVQGIDGYYRWTRQHTVIDDVDIDFVWSEDISDFFDIDEFSTTGESIYLKSMLPPDGCAKVLTKACTPTTFKERVLKIAVTEELCK